MILWAVGYSAPNSDYRKGLSPLPDCMEDIVNRLFFSNFLLPSIILPRCPLSPTVSSYVASPCIAGVQFSRKSMHWESGSLDCVSTIPSHFELSHFISLSFNYFPPSSPLSSKFFKLSKSGFYFKYKGVYASLTVPS